MTSSLSIELFCPHCGQKLTLSPEVLHSDVRCPRCLKIESAAKIIDPTHPIPAIPVVREQVSEAPALAEPAGSSGSTQLVEQKVAPGEPQPSQPPPLLDIEPAEVKPEPTAASEPYAHQSSAAILPPPPSLPPPPPPANVSPSNSVFTLPPTQEPQTQPVIPRRRASDVAQFGLSWARRGIIGVINAADYVDAKSYGYRGVIYAGTAALYTLAFVATALFRLIDSHDVAQVLSTTSSVLLSIFFALGVVYAVAQLSFLVGDGDEKWPALPSPKSVFSSVRDRLSDWRALDDRSRSLATLRTVGGCASILFACQGVLQWFWEPKPHSSEETVIDVMTALVAATVVGTIIAFIRTWITRAPIVKRLPLATEFADPERTKATVLNELPEVIDVVRHGPATLELARRLPDRFTGEMLEALARWKPRQPSQARERLYQNSLRRHLRKLSDKVEVERPLGGRYQGRRRRIDLMVAECFGVELKLRLRRSADIDRALGQVRSYADKWDRGPILLVVCETDETFVNGPLRQIVRELRQQSRAVVAIAAGRAATR